MFCFSISDHEIAPQRTVSFKFRGGLKGPRPPFFGLLNISALHVQYGIQAFAKFKRPECTRLHLRELQSQKLSQRNMCPKLPRKVRRSQSHIATVFYISRPPLSQNPPSAPV